MRKKKFTVEPEEVAPGIKKLPAQHPAGAYQGKQTKTCKDKEKCIFFGKELKTHFFKRKKEKKT